jgi:hypothetical protein
MTTEQMLIAAVGAMASVIVYLFILLQKRTDQLIQLKERINNGFTEDIKEFIEIIKLFKELTNAKREESKGSDT